MPVFGVFNVSDVSIAALQAFFDEWSNYPADRVAKKMHVFSTTHGLDSLFAAHDVVDFDRRAIALFRWHITAKHQATRRAQLLDGQFKFWVYRVWDDTCSHASWDGFAAPSEHPIWLTHFPANGWSCRCGLHGTDSERGIVRLHGDATKLLPDQWDTIDPATGLPPGIEPGFGGTNFPTFHACLQAIADGVHLRLL